MKFIQDVAVGEAAHRAEAADQRRYRANAQAWPPFRDRMLQKQSSVVEIPSVMILTRVSVLQCDFDFGC